MNNWRKMIVSCACIAVFGCATPPPPPPVYTAPIDVSLEKVTQPAFAQDYAEKTVRFDASYMGSFAQLIDLPAEYQQGFVRIMLMHGTASTINVVVPKEFADTTFALKTGQMVRVTAYAQPLDRYSIAGTHQGELLLIANAIEPLGESPGAPRRKSKH